MSTSSSIAGLMRPASSTSQSNTLGITSPPPWYIHDVSSQSGIADLPPLTIPTKHNTSSSYLLSLPGVKALIGEYPPDLFFSLESKNSLPSELSFGELQAPNPRLQIEPNLTDYLVSAFFSKAFPCHPILDPQVFQSIYNRFLDTGIDSSIESALCLVVLALGAAAVAPRDSGSFSTSPPGFEYMQSALPTLLYLSSWSFSWNILLPQALVISSVYFAYIARPLQSWRLIYSASNILQFRLCR